MLSFLTLDEYVDELLKYIHKRTNSDTPGVSINNIMSKQHVPTLIDRVKNKSELPKQLLNKTSFACLLVGATGSGKSTIMNIVAGNKIICTLNDCEGFDISADPCVAPIGNCAESMTFIPNYYRFPNGSVCIDSPGFFDNREIQYEIAKSILLKKLGDVCQEIKIVMVCELNCLQGERGGSFRKTVEQISMFIPGFCFASDSVLIVTKVPSHNTCKGILNMLKKLGFQYPESQLHLFREPDRTTYQLAPFDALSILQSAPSVKSKCRIPLSSEALLALQQQKQKEMQAIQLGLKTIAKKMRVLYFLRLLNNASQSIATIEQIGSEFASFFNRLRTSFSGQEDLMLKDVLLPSQLEPVIKTLQKKKDNLAFIESITKDKVVELDFKQWEDHLKLIPFVKTLDSSPSSLNAQHLHAKFGLARMPVLAKDLQCQFVFNSPICDYKTIRGQLTYKRNIPIKVNRQFHVSEQDEAQLHFEGKAQISETRPYVGSVYTPNCSHNKGLFNIPCLNCSHHQIGIQYSGNTHLLKTVPYSGSILHKWKWEAVGQVNFSDTRTVTGSKPYQQKVYFTKDHQVICPSHGKCLCRSIGELVQSSNQIQTHLLFLNSLCNQAASLLSDNESEYRFGQQAKCNNVALRRFGGPKTNLQLLSSNIHNELSGQREFTFSYEYKVMHKVEIPYEGKIKYKEIVPFSKLIRHQDQVTYSKQLPYSFEEEYVQHVAVRSCYQNCLFCNGYKKNSSKLAKGIVQFQGKWSGVGNVPHSVQKTITGKKQIIGEQSYAGIVSDEQEVLFKGVGTTNCPAKNLGDGHHDIDRQLNVLNECFACAQKQLNLQSSCKTVVEKLIQVLKEEFDNLQ